MRKLILAVLLSLPLGAWADTCTKSASSPNNSSVPDGSPVSIYCDSNGNLYTTTAGSSGGGSTTANQGTQGTAGSAWFEQLVFAGTPLALGQATEASSIPVVLPSNQTVNVSQVPSSASAGGISLVTSTALEASHVLKASSGNFYGVTVYTSTTPGYVLIYNATSAPANGSVTPADFFYIPCAPCSTGYSANNVPNAYSTGISVVFSTTGPYTQTSSATAAFVGRVQ